jgi:putative salt-induced outer membrane protein
VRRLLVAFLVLSSFSVTAGAAEPSPASTTATGRPWQAEIGMGLLLTTGNTRNTTFNSTANGNYAVGRWGHTGRLEVTTNRSDGVTTAERYYAQAKSDYHVGEKGNYVYVLLSYEDDRFTGFAYQADESVGYGRSVIQGPPLKLNLEAGVGDRQRKVIDTGERQSEVSMRLAGSLDWAVSAQATFREELATDVTRDLTQTSSIASLTAEVLGDLAIKLQLRIRNLSGAPVGFLRTDTETTANLVYRF